MLALAGCRSAAEVPSYEARECWFTPPHGVTAECGIVRVPEDRGEPFSGANEIELAVAVFRSTADAPAADPVFYLAGGPGERAIETSLRIFASLDFVLGTRDLVVFDQRGAGRSVPSLDCPDDVSACHDRLVQAGVDLSAYVTRANAADVEDVRRALGYDRINLLGGSYGTRLGLAVLRDHPGSIRSAVLDSVAPVQSDVGTGVVANNAAALRVLFSACAEDRVCHGKYPDLESELPEAVGRLDRVPLPGTGPTAAPITGADLLRAVLTGMYFAEAIPVLPHVIHAAYEGDAAPVDDLIQRLAAARGDGAEGMMWSIECAENTAYETDAEYAQVGASIDPPIRDHLMQASLYASGICDVWAVPAVPEADKAPVVSSVPTLLLAGQFDPVTPMAWAALAAEGLANHHLYEFPAAGHGVLRTSACARAMIEDFLREPGSPPDATCVPLEPPPAFT